MNVVSSSLEWYSSRDGYLGKGNGLFVTLRRGSHVIETQYNDKTYAISIDVQQDNVQYLEERRQIVTPKEIKVNLTEGKWHPALITLEGITGYLSYSNPQPRNMPLSASGKSRLAGQLRDFHVVSGDLKDLKPVKPRSRLLRSSVGDKKVFNVLNTSNQYDEPHEILGEMIYSGGRFTIWRDIWSAIDAVALAQCISNLETIIIPRLLSIWGEWADVDGDGKIAILFSQTINTEAVAVGYFNPQDFFLSEDSNPQSNQMDIVYAGYPVNSPNSSYSPEAVSATIAHEITHAITFSQKTYNKIAMGNVNAQRETVFLDEGWSHLSENLCGFGASGGNILFLKQFFDNTADYSFCSPNAVGQIDSAGMRGAMCLFFSWLFWKQGGMNWNSTNPGIVYDNGGISFLKNLVGSDQIGWKSIGDSIGVTMDELFLEFIYDMNRQRALNTVYPYKTDPHTGEPVEFFNNMGFVSCQDNTYNVFIRVSVPPNTVLHTPMWSFFFIDSAEIEEESMMKINLEYSLGKVLFSMVKG
jgi:hypothetical protein